jgi:DNA-binding transcriptional MerR regulator
VTDPTQPSGSPGRRQARAEGPAEWLTIDELSRATGMTARNIRAHQSRGLVPPPEVRGRTGYYGPEHRVRLELIRELQDDGFNLAAIGRLLAGAGGSAAEVLRFTRAARATFAQERPEVVDRAELGRRFDGRAGRAALARAERIGLLRALPDGRYELRSPRLWQAGEELARFGVPPDRVLDATEALAHHADGAARTFVELFLDGLWEPFEAAGRPPDRWPEVREALERLRPLAAESLLAMFQLLMTDRVDEAFGREMSREDDLRRSA